MLEDGILGHRFDTNVYPLYRNQHHYKDISRWATHSVAIARFVEEHKSDWLLVIESQIELSVLPELVDGLTLLGPDISAYIVDRTTAQIIVDNSLIYYAPFPTVIADLQKLDLIKVNESRILQTIKKPPNVFLLILILLFIILAYPLYSLCAKGFVSLTKMFGTVESVANG